jgi:hypothetical protein
MLRRVFGVLCLLSVSAPVRADLIPTEHIANGTFGTTVPSVPSLLGWTTASNTTSNWTATTVPPNLGAGPYATTGNASSSSNQRLFQDFALPSLAQASATLSWRDAFDSAIDWIDGAQEYRVVLQRVVAGSPVGPLLEAFSTALNPTVLSAGPTTRSKSDSELLNFVSANLGQTVRLSFEAIDNGTIPTVSVDSVSFVTVFDTASVPEPSSLLLSLLPGAYWALRRRRRSRSGAADL